jgi:hypothetical protein
MLQQEGTFFSRALWFRAKHGLKGFELAGDWNFWREMAHHGVYYQYESPLGAFRRRVGQLSGERIGDYRAEIERVVPLEVRRGRFEELYREQEWDANVVKFDRGLGTMVLKIESVQRLFGKRGNEGIDVGKFISKINEETSLVDADQNLGKLIVITTLGSLAVSMPQPILSAFKKHAQNSYITEVHIISEDDLTWLKNLCQDIGYDFEKFKYISVERRPTFSMLISYANQLINRENSENCICALMNSDISFGCDDDVASCLSSINSISKEEGKVIYALTRRDCVESDWQLTLYESTGLPNDLSADCWVFSSPINLPQADFYSMGQMNCDLMLGYDLVTSGFQVYNPCLDLKIHHHESELKTNDYYNEQNQKISNRDLLSLHYVRRRNEPFEVFGFSWISSEWIKIGYRPLPYSRLRKKLYITLSAPLIDVSIYSLFSIELFAKEHDFDLVFVTDCSLENLFLQLKPIGLVNRNVYFVKLRNTIDEFIIGLIKGNQWNFNKLAILSNPSLLTHSIGDYTQAIVLDFRSWQLYPPSEREILCPEITDDYKWLLVNRYENFVDQLFVNESINRENKCLCTLVTSVYKSDSFINSFFTNCEKLIGYSDQINHIALISQISDYETDCIKDWLYRNRNAILLWHKEDPGLYECWNIGIRLAETEFVSNANVDDLRHPKHVMELVADLQGNPHLCVATSAIVPFETYITNIEEIDSSQPWYVDEAGEFGFTSLAHLEVENETYKLKAHNLPHCMPVWRKQLHDIYGFFEEKRYGTYSDWAFWLKVTKAGERGYLNPAPLSYYYINLNSHNRRPNNLERLHREIEIEYVESFYFRLNISSIQESSSSIFRFHQEKQRLFEPKLNLYSLTQSFGEHRNSFNKLIESLLPLDIGESGIKFLPFIERYFVWGDEEGEASSNNPQPLDKEWIGIIHVPFNAPAWFEPCNSPENIFQTQLWINSLPFCKGLICFTENLRKDVQEWYPNLPTFSCAHPTELNDLKPFDFTAYQRFPRIVQVGDWLRKLQSIYQLHTQSHQKLILTKPCTRKYMRREKDVFGDFRNDSVTELEFVSNEEYDSLLSSSVVLCLLYATAANNVVIECIARGTPILVNPLPSVIEYLGEDYPLYVKDIYEAETLLKQENKIQAASDYLLKRQKYIDLSYQAWLENIGQSDFYNNL